MLGGQTFAKPVGERVNLQVLNHWGFREARASVVLNGEDLDPVGEFIRAFFF